MSTEPKGRGNEGAGISGIPKKEGEERGTEGGIRFTPSQMAASAVKAHCNPRSLARSSDLDRKPDLGMD